MSHPPDRLAKALQDSCAHQREMGRGGVGTRYRTTELADHRSIAQIVLAPGWAAALRPERLRREIRSAPLTHPYTLPWRR
jgi:hypothetical protein